MQWHEYPSTWTEAEKYEYELKQRETAILLLRDWVARLRYVRTENKQLRARIAILEGVGTDQDAVAP